MSKESSSLWALLVQMLVILEQSIMKYKNCINKLQSTMCDNNWLIPLLIPFKILYTILTRED